MNKTQDITLETAIGTRSIAHRLHGMTAVVPPVAGTGMSSLMGLVTAASPVYKQKI